MDDTVTLTLTEGNFQDGQTVDIGRVTGTVVTDVAGNEQDTAETSTFTVTAAV